jgi:outer membrane protein assembly factor BamB
MPVTRPTVSKLARARLLAGWAVCVVAAGRQHRGMPAALAPQATDPDPRPSETTPAKPASSQGRSTGGRLVQLPPVGQDWGRFGWDVGRSSAPSTSMGVTALNVAALRRQQVRIDGTVDASAIYLQGVPVHGVSVDVLFVTTTYGKTLALDASTGALLWEYTPPGYTTWVGSSRITTATPVADPDRAFVYAASPDGKVQKLAVADGHVAWSTAITNLPRREKIASALNYFHGHVIAATGGYVGDAAPYQGHVALLDGESGRLLHVWNTLCSDRPGLLDPGSCSESGSAVWGRAGAVIDSTTGNIFVATGNGRWDGSTHWGDAVLEVDSEATRLMGNYTPTNTDVLDARDADLGSTSPVWLGNGLIAQGGKDGSIRLLDWRRMQGAEPHRGGERQVVGTPSGGDLFTAPAVLHTTAATWIFAADNGGTATWTLSDGRLQPMWRNGNAGTSPVVADGLLFVYDPRGGLHVYEAPTGRELATLECGSGHWNSPIVAGGRIVLPEGNSNDHATNGILDIWRVP